MTLKEEIIKTKVIDFEELYNFSSYQLFHLKSYIQVKLRLNFSFLKFELSKQPQMEKRPKSER